MFLGMGSTFNLSGGNENSVELYLPEETVRQLEAKKIKPEMGFKNAFKAWKVPTNHQ